VNLDIRELLAGVKTVGQERLLDEETVVSAVEEALALVISRHRKVDERDYRVHLDRKEGAIRGFRRWRVLEEDEVMTNPEYEVMLDIAQAKDPDSKPGDYIEEEVGQDEVNERLNAQMARQYIQQRLRDAERNKALEEFQDRGEDLVHATVRKVDHTTGDAICESYGVECFLRKEDQIPRESLRSGDRIRAIVKEINRDGRVPRLYVTRASVDFLKKLFEREVPEIENGVLEIVNAVRDPGHRAKIAVRSNDPKVDPVGTCVGIRGSRVQSVTNEINGERIDIIQWHDTPTDYVLRAISPADIEEVLEDDDGMTLIVSEDKVATTIGRNGSNIRLASELTGWRLTVSTKEEADTDRQEMADRVIAMFMERLDIDKDAAEILYNEGFDDIEVVGYTERDEMVTIKGFTEEFVDELQARAKKIHEEDEDKIQRLMEKVDPKLVELEDMDEQLLKVLVREEILTLEDLGDLASDELMELTSLLDESRANRLIMAARAPMLEG